MKLEKSESICRVENPVTWTSEKCQVFVDACREMALFHEANCPEIKHLYRREGFSPQSLQTEEDIQKIPMIGVAAMKQFLLLSKPQAQSVLHLTSSGTKGLKTQVLFDQESLDRAQAMLDVLWEQEGLKDRAANYVNFIYDPKEAQDLGISFSVDNEQRFAPPKESFYAVRKNSVGAWEFRLGETVATLERFAREGLPVRLLGIPSFLFDLLSHLEETGKKISLPAGSLMMTGGGWKAAEDRKITRELFRSKVTKYLGICDERLRDGFGMAEHAAPYMECRKHRQHVPVYNRIYARDPDTLRVLPPGETGLLEFVTPLNTMMPTLAILSTDLGYLDREPCECGWNSPTFTLVGRGGLVKHKGCAITAGEIVKRK